MYKIDKTDLGFHLTFSGAMTKAEIEKWYAESELVLIGQQAPFGVIIDMRTLGLLPVDAQGVIVRGQAMYRSRGMERSCVVFDDAITKIQFMRLAKRSGIFKYERYINASRQKNWLAEAHNWVRHAITPRSVRGRHWQVPLNFSPSGSRCAGDVPRIPPQSLGR